MGLADDAFQSGVLDQEVHGRLVQDIERIAGTANIPVAAICTPLGHVCDEKTVDWVKGAKFHQETGDHIGLVFTGEIEQLNDKVDAMAGAFIRNFIDARVMTIEEIMSRIQAMSMPDPSVLLVPNFWDGKDGIPKWHKSMVLGLLFARASARQLTVLYIKDLEAMATDLGPTLRDHLNKYQLIWE